MGGMKVWYALMLLALIGVVQADTQTTLTQYVTPPSGTQMFYVSPNFTCFYNNDSGGMVTGASVYVYITTFYIHSSYTTPYQATEHYIGNGTGYYSIENTQGLTFVTLYSGAHAWYCNASKAGYQQKIGLPQPYDVLYDLTGSVTPASGTSYGPVKPDFECLTMDTASVRVNIDGISYTATYKTYKASGHAYFNVSNVPLNAGTHTWYCNATYNGLIEFNKTQTYTVKASGGGGSPLMMKTVCSGCAEPVEQLPVGNFWTFSVIVITIIGLGIGYFIVRSALFSTIPTAKAKKPKKK